MCVSIRCLSRAGVNCPRAPNLKDKDGPKTELFGQEALTFTKELIIQREVTSEPLCVLYTAVLLMFLLLVVNTLKHCSYI